LLLGAVLVWRSYAGITGISDLLTTMSEKSLKQEATERLKTETLALSEQVSGYINSAYSVALTTASIASDSIKHPSERLNRVQLSNLLEASLSSNTSISSIYAHFEANAYDGQDASYVNSSLAHSTKQTGSFESYWIREDSGKVVAVQVKDPKAKYSTETDENGLGGSFNQFIQKLRDMVLALKDVSVKVRNESSTNLRTSQQTTQATDAQQNEITNVVTATQEMSATAQQVASIAADVATRANDIQSEVSRSQRNLATAVDSSLELTDNMNTASAAITQVSARSEDINRILVVIGSIAEQTNLLALNAAIEAARAGEQGRGFAVVADEVRTLASKTQSSTAEIRSMIDSLQNEVKQAVSIIELGRTQATGAMEQTQQAHESLQKVVDAITAIADHIHQVATAAEEQSSVSEEITRNLTVIGDAARTLSELAQQANQSSKQVTGQLDELDYQLSALRT
jgi:methyl-accepting chemotaxis protein